MDHPDTNPEPHQQMRALYPHLQLHSTLVWSRIVSFRQRQKVPTGENGEILATMKNMRAHLKHHFPKNTFSVKPVNKEAIEVSWTQWEAPLGSAPDPLDVKNALEIFTYWHSYGQGIKQTDDTTKKAFHAAFGGIHHIVYIPTAPKPSQVAKRMRSKLNAVAKEAIEEKLVISAPSKGPKL